MANYIKSTNFTAKDSLPSGDSARIVKGTEIDVEFSAISSAIASKSDSNSPSFTGTPTAPTPASGTNTTQLATTAFVKSSVDALGTIGTMASQAASAVAITGGSITNITDIVVADGGTGRSTLDANAVLLGNGTSPLQVVAPSTAGNVLTSNGTTWTSTSPSTPTVITQQARGTNTTHSINVSGTNRPIMLSMHYSGIQGGNTNISVNFQWGLGSLSNTFNCYPNVGVNFVVDPGNSITVYLTPTSATTLQFRVNTVNLGNETFWVSAIQL
jgi:hypothetical protein